jgi:hypothetical protein
MKSLSIFLLVVALGMSAYTDECVPVLEKRVSDLGARIKTIEDNQNQRLTPTQRMRRGSSSVFIALTTNSISISAIMARRTEREDIAFPQPYLSKRQKQVSNK